MSLYNYDDMFISSNNSINENKYNHIKSHSKSHKIKAILKPILKMLRRSKKEIQQPQYQEESYCDECCNNSANEELESRLIEELETCPPESALLVCEEGEWRVASVQQVKPFVPVHFARTEAGTFFWTSASADCDLLSSRHCYTECQDPSAQIPLFCQDRWVQA